MSQNNLLRTFNIALMISLIFGGIVSAGTPFGVREVQAGGSGANAVVGLINIINAANRRRRLYNEARTTQRDMTAYYDKLIAEARSQLQERELQGAGQSQLGVYIKLVATLEAERAAVTAQIEAEKNQARRDFNRTLGNQVTNVLINSPGGQKILGQVRETIDGLRQSAIAIQEALNAGRPVDMFVAQFASRYENIPILQNAVHNLGTELGQKIDESLGGLFGQLEAVSENLQAEIGLGITKVNDLDFIVANYQNQDRSPANLFEEGTNIRPVDRGNGPLDVAVEALTRVAEISGLYQGSGQTRETMRDRIRQQLLTQRNSRFALAGIKASLVYCVGASEGEYQAAAGELGIAPETPRDPLKARYLICYDKETGSAIHVALIGPAAEAPGGEPDSEETTGQNQEEPVVVDTPDTQELPGELPFNGVAHGSPVCGADEEYPYRWVVSLIQNESGNISGTIRFHACPEGGQAIYGVTGTVSEEAPDTAILQGTKREGWGDLGNSAPDHQVFRYTVGLPPAPNLAR